MPTGGECCFLPSDVPKNRGLLDKLARHLQWFNKLGRIPEVPVYQIVHPNCTTAQIVQLKLYTQTVHPNCTPNLYNGTDPRSTSVPNCTPKLYNGPNCTPKLYSLNCTPKLCTKIVYPNCTLKLYTQVVHPNCLPKSSTT